MDKNPTPLKTNMSPKKGTISIGNTSSNHQFSGDMLIFRGVHHDYPMIYRVLTIPMWCRILSINSIFQLSRTEYVSGIQTLPVTCLFRNRSRSSYATFHQNQNSTQVRRCRFASLPQAPETTTVQRAVPCLIEIDKFHTSNVTWGKTRHIILTVETRKSWFVATTTCKTVTWGKPKKIRKQREKTTTSGTSDVFSNPEFWTANCLGGQLWPLKEAHDLKSCQEGVPSGFPLIDFNPSKIS